MTDNDTGLFRIAFVRQKTKIQFDAVYRYFFEHIQGRIAAAKIIHFNLESALPQRFRRTDQQVRILGIGRFGNLDPQLVRGQAIGSDQILEMTGKIPALTNVTAGQVYRNRLTDPCK